MGNPLGDYLALRWIQRMKSPQKSPSWDEARRILASKSHDELLTLIRDSVRPPPENKDFISPAEAWSWCYLVARDYDERDNSRYGMGLIPESAPVV